ncbi:MAG: hypothetical protein WCG19_05915 [Chlorobiaceae bacterium]
MDKPFIAFMLLALRDTMTEVLVKTSEKTVNALYQNCSMTFAEFAQMPGLSNPVD